ncbi:MAG: hypothetical protein V4622_12025 [Bacteroidota bacterium]
MKIFLKKFHSSSGVGHIQIIEMRILLYLTILFGQNIFAQTTISISPLINYKLLICGYPTDQMFGIYSENQSINPQNPYYSFYAKRISHRPSINIGLRVTANLKGDKHVLTAEWSQDEMGTMSKTTALVTSNTFGLPEPAYKTYGNGISYFQNGFVFSRLSLAYGRRLSKESSLQKFWLLMDYSLARTVDNKAEWRYENFPENNSVYYYNNAKWISTEHEAYIYKGIYSMLGIGVKTDFSLKLKQKNTYFFTVETHFRQGLKAMGFGSETTTIDDNGEIMAFRNILVSKASGFYFQISRKFQIYPWKSKKSKI